MKFLIVLAVFVLVFSLLIGYSFFMGKAKLPEQNEISSEVGSEIDPNTNSEINTKTSYDSYSRTASKIKKQTSLIQEAKDIGINADASAKKCYDIFEEVLIMTDSYDDDMKKKVAQARSDLANGEKLSQELSESTEKVNGLIASHFSKGEK